MASTIVGRRPVWRVRSERMTAAGMLMSFAARPRRIPAL